MHDRLVAAHIVKLGAFCDLSSDDGNGRLSFDVVEFAQLSDGTRVELDHRGWTQQVRAVSAEAPSSSPRSLEEPFEPWQYQTRQELEDAVRAVVLPDDDEKAAKQDHDWEWLAECAASRGLATSAGALAGLAYEIELSDSVLSRLAAR